MTMLDIKSTIFLLLLLVHVSHCTIYVMGDDEYSLLVAWFGDVVNLFGPAFFHVEGFLMVTSPPNGCSSISPVVNESTSLVDRHSHNDTQLEDTFIALIKDGDCDPDLKVLNAQQAGFVGAILYSKNNQTLVPFDGHDWLDQISIPSVRVNRFDGERLKLYTYPGKEKFLVSVINFYYLPLKYIVLCFLLLVAATLFILTGCLAIHLCNLWYRARRERLSRSHLRRLLVKRFVKGQDPYETCSICLEDYEERQKIRLLPCQHAFHSDCIDPWLLRNRRRCPICNRIVDVSSARIADQENPPITFAQRFRISFIRFSRGLTPMFLRRRASERPHDAAPCEVVDDTTPLLEHCSEASPSCAHQDFTESAGPSEQTFILNMPPEFKRQSSCQSDDSLCDVSVHAVIADTDDQLLCAVDSEQAEQTSTL